MPLNIPVTLPAVDALLKENIFVMDSERASSQEIRPLKIVILNLMPIKVTTETDLIRLLSNSPLQIEIDFMHMESHTSKNTSIEHLNTFYKTFEEVSQSNYDGMIITGAPVELMEFEEVNYWQEITKIFDWAKTHVTSTFYICWAAQAGLYYHYGIPKRILPKKKFGVYAHRVKNRKIPLVRGFDDVFYAPHSRHTEVLKEDILKHPELTILAESDDAGVFLLMDQDGKKIFVMGHPEYDRYTLDKEYKRDVAKGMNIALPENYYTDNDPDKEPRLQWRGHANTLYTNWINYYVYQATPYIFLGKPKD